MSSKRVSVPCGAGSFRCGGSSSSSPVRSIRASARKEAFAHFFDSRGAVPHGVPGVTSLVVSQYYSPTGRSVPQEDGGAQMQFRRAMRFTWALPVLLAGTAALFVPDRAGAEVKVALPDKRVKVARELRTNAASDPDTVWIGHVQSATGLPGTAGGYGPYKIGRGTRLHNGAASDFPNGVWTFDNFQGGTDVDSLQGWWPIALPYNSVGGSNQNDKNRPFYGFDYGNQGNYVIPQGAPKRTFGVTGYWHRDGGSTQPAVASNVSHKPVHLTWAPLGGSFSAWCGLRSHGDVAAVDAVANGGTGNPFNQSLLEYNGNNTTLQVAALSPDGTDKNFPGYGSQWDQLLYRDVSVAGGGGAAAAT